MAQVDVNDFNREVEVVYKGDVYSVRDNGAIMRHAKEGTKTRPKDNIWSFGNKDLKTGYMFWGKYRVHIIVCNAFNGEMPQKEMVVDHIDTNRCNNRPENLRWLTKLQNALNNDITRAKIIECCGSIEAFVENPSILRKYVNAHSNFHWMRTVTPQEAKNAYDNFIRWATDANRKKPVGKGVGEWIYQKKWGDTKDVYGESDWVQSLTPNAKQKNWKIPCEFVLCPAEGSISDYYNNIKVDSIFIKSQYGEQTVLDYAISDDNQMMWVMTHIDNVFKEFGLLEITLDADVFVHKSLGMFSRRDGADKYFTLAQGKEWTGGIVFDDFC